VFKDVYLRAAFISLLLLPPAASAATDSFANSNVQNANAVLSTKLNDNIVRDDNYKIALSVQVVDPRDMDKSYQEHQASDHHHLPKSAWWAACGIAFLSVMRRRLSK
jgi:hypothetical protein